MTIHSGKMVRTNGRIIRENKSARETDVFYLEIRRKFVGSCLPKVINRFFSNQENHIGCFLLFLFIVKQRVVYQSNDDW